MSTAKPATAAAGDVELAKSRLVTGVDPPSTPAGEGSSLAGTRGAPSSVRFRLSSLWSEMFHDAPGGMVRIAWKGRSGIGPEFLLFLFFNGSAYLLRQARMASTGKDPCAPPLANRQIEARRCCEATLSRRENGTAAGLAVWNWKEEKKGQTRNLADVAAALVVVPLSTPNFSLKKKTDQGGGGLAPHGHVPARRVGPFCVLGE
jgi:hypothetical protein